MRTFQLVLGAFAVVLLVLMAGAFNQGMERLLQATGSEDNIMLIGAGAVESIERSSISAEAENVAAATPGVAQISGRQAVSTEVHYMAPFTLDDGTETRGYFRGVTPQSLLVHTKVRLTEGRFPVPGEIMVGRLAHRSLRVAEEQVAIGKTIKIGANTLKISGKFAAPDTRYESEIWGDKNDLLAISRREEPSCVIARTYGGNTVGMESIPFQRSDLEAAAIPEKEYYENLSKFFGPIIQITWISALLVAAGAVFGGFNTLYAAFGVRAKELASLQAVGFNRFSILISMLTESLIACLLGTLAACLVGVLFVQGFTISLSAGTLTLAMSLSLLVMAIATGTLLGVIGAAIPAWNCLRQPLPIALRSI